MAMAMVYLASSNGAAVRLPNRAPLPGLRTLCAKAGMIEGFVALYRYAHDRLRATPRTDRRARCP